MCNAKILLLTLGTKYFISALVRGKENKDIPVDSRQLDVK
jgi:hypothetical protein